MPLSRASSAGKRERARAYNKALPLTIRCLTWNVGNAKPVAAELAHALPDGLDEDIIVVGTQVSERPRAAAAEHCAPPLSRHRPALRFPRRVRRSTDSQLILNLKHTLSTLTQSVLAVVQHDYFAQRLYGIFVLRFH